MNKDNTSILYKGPIFSIVRTELELNGKMVDRDVLVHSGGAGILALQDGKVLMVRQKRAGSGREMIEIPAGMIDGNEDPKQTALRELNEETGYEAEKIELIISFYPTPGYDSERLFIYRATGLAPAKKRLEMDADEEIDLFWMDLDEAKAKVFNGEIEDAKTIIALLMA